MRRIAVAAPLVALLVLAGSAGAAAAAPWVKLSPDDVAGIDGSALTVSNGLVIAAWPSGSGGELAGAIAFRGWAPTPSKPLESISLLSGLQ